MRASKGFARYVPRTTPNAACSFIYVFCSVESPARWLVLSCPVLCHFYPIMFTVVGPSSWRTYYFVRQANNCVSRWRGQCVRACKYSYLVYDRTRSRAAWFACSRWILKMGFTDDLIIILRSNEKSSIYPLTVTVSTMDRWRCFTYVIAGSETLTARCSEFSVCACRNQ